MGKSLIIKGADFSLVAVGREIVEPTEYCILAGYGAKGDFNVGEYYIASATNQYGKLYYKQDENTAVDVSGTIEDGTVFKFLDTYYLQYFSSSPKHYEGYYNLESVADFTDGAYVVSEGQVELRVIDGASHMQITLKNGDTLVYNTRGGNTYPGLIIEDQGGNVTVKDDRSTGFQIMVYTAEGNETAYINSLTSYLTNGAFVCKAK